MPAWRDIVLQHFLPATGNLILVADPDALLREEQVLAALTARGYDVLTYDDPVAFRYVYESQYRAHVPGTSQVPGTSSPPSLIVRTDQPDVRSLPYDLLVAGRHLILGLHELAPNLSYPVVRNFFRAAPELFDRLIEACRDMAGPRLGDNRSLAFIARHVYNLDPAALRDLNDLVERLLQVHYHGWPIFERLRTWLADELGKKPAFGETPLARWLADRRSFFEFLEGQWRAYLRANGLTLAETGPVYEVHPLAVDFDRLGIRSLVSMLFLEDRLRPAQIIAERPPAGWTALGTVTDTTAHRQERLRQLLDRIVERLPGQDAGYRQWLDLAPLWAEAAVLRHRAPLQSALTDRCAQVQADLTAAFVAWLQVHYNALHSLPYLPAPVVGHQVAHALAARMRGGTERVALLVLDGLSLDGWQVLRSAWGGEARGWRCAEGALFACLPTV
ncbi:MAG: BREX-3 system phosphatase PglZ, partial [Anaerolineae bacterium]|nr:BREX-3 system phosphatase PglZ [Anaerolineae bacterium]